jgi:hypothetical protein
MNKICTILLHIIGKVQYLLHKLFPKHIPIMSCYECLSDTCNHRTTKHNSICYYHKKYKGAIGGCLNENNK